MSDLTRREAVQTLALAAAAFTWTPLEVARAATAVRAAGAPGAPPHRPVAFSAHEWKTLRVLVDLVIPRDERSGSATEAGVPEFMDFLLRDSPDGLTAMQGGLAWLDTECRERFGRDFLGCAETERAAVLDDIAWPARARPELSHGVAFFNRFRDLTASGFWSSRVGVEDLRYLGNTAVLEWTGCPEEQLRRLGVSY